MLRSAFTLAATLTAAVAITGSAAAAIMVLGAGPEKQCYEAAKSHRSTMAAFQACEMALDNIALPTNDRAATFVNRSVLHLVRSSAVAALADADSALRIEPALTAAAVNRAAALYLLERYAEAKVTLDGAIPLATDSGELQRALFNRAMANEALGDVKAAYADLKRAVSIDPTFTEAQVELARYSVR